VLLAELMILIEHWDGDMYDFNEKRVYDPKDKTHLKLYNKTLKKSIRLNSFLHRKNSFCKSLSKNVASYKFENNFIELSN